MDLLLYFESVCLGTIDQHSPMLKCYSPKGQVTDGTKVQCEVHLKKHWESRTVKLHGASAPASTTLLPSSYVSPSQYQRRRG
jgi:hypothetical protein